MGHSDYSFKINLLELISSIASIGLHVLLDILNVSGLNINPVAEVITSQILHVSTRSVLNCCVNIENCC
jgi:hypothetical protein